MGHLKLHAYQKRAIEFWLANPRTYFAIDMGLGKTAIALHGIQQIKQPTLVIAPLHTIYTTWPEEIQKWKIPLKWRRIHGEFKDWAIRQPADIYLANFESIHVIYDYLVECMNKKRKPNFSVCVIDEGTKIKSHKAERFKFLDAIQSAFPKYRAILSGTPMPNGQLDLWSQYKFLTNGKCFQVGTQQSYGKFRKTFFDADPYRPYTWNIKKGAAQTIYKSVAPYTFRLDEKDHLDMPDLVFNNIKGQLPNNLRKLYNQYKKDFVVEIDDIIHEVKSAGVQSLKLRQFVQGFLYYYKDEVEKKAVREVQRLHAIKLKLFLEFMDTINKPVLCSIMFKEEVNMIQEKIPGTPVIHGATSAYDAARYIKQWNAGQLPLLLCHPASLAHGINMQYGGNVLLWYNMPWSLELYQQLVKRLHRQGQKSAVVVHHLLLSNTIDEKVVKGLNRRDMTQREFLEYLKKEMQK